MRTETGIRALTFLPGTVLLWLLYGPGSGGYAFLAMNRICRISSDRANPIERMTLDDSSTGNSVPLTPKKRELLNTVSVGVLIVWVRLLASCFALPVPTHPAAEESKLGGDS